MARAGNRCLRQIISFEGRILLDAHCMKLRRRLNRVERVIGYQFQVLASAESAWELRTTTLISRRNLHFACIHLLMSQKNLYRARSSTFNSDPRSDLELSCAPRGNAGRAQMSPTRLVRSQNELSSYVPQRALWFPHAGHGREQDGTRLRGMQISSHPRTTIIKIVRLGGEAIEGDVSWSKGTGGLKTVSAKGARAPRRHQMKAINTYRYVLCGRPVSDLCSWYVGPALRPAKPIR